MNAPVSFQPHQSYSFNGHVIRIVLRDGDPWFVATDVCAALNIQNPTQTVARLDDDERSMFNIGRQGQVIIINESGMWTLVLRCRDAIKMGTIPHRFRKRITSEVLPSIRKTGSYSTQPEPQPSRPAVLTEIPAGYILVDKAWLQDLKWGVTAFTRIRELVDQLKAAAMPVGQIDACLSHLGGHFIDGARMILSDAGMAGDAKALESHFGRGGFVQPY